MKKIVGLLAAAAVLATSVFAADVSAQVKINGSLFDYNGAAVDKKDGKEAGSFSLLTAKGNNDWEEYAKLAVSTDNAGAQVKFWANAKDDDLKIKEYQVWFKPIDMLKITAGHQDININKETIEYGGCINGFGTDFGYSINVAVDAFSLDVGFGTTKNGYFFTDAVGYCGTSEDPAFAFIRDLYAKAAYSADFGTIGAFFELKGKTLNEEKTAAGDPQTVRFGAGYKNTFDALTIFADVTGTSKSGEGEKLQAIGFPKDGVFGLAFDAFVQYAQDALTAKAYLWGDIANFDNKNEKGDKDIMANNNFVLGFKGRVDYKLDNGLTVYGFFKNGNFLQKELKAEDTEKSSVFVAEIKAGLSGSVGIAGWDVAIDLNTGKGGKYDKLSVSMPCVISCSF